MGARIKNFIFFLSNVSFTVKKKLLFKKFCVKSLVFVSKIDFSFDLKIFLNLLLFFFYIINDQ